MCLGNMYVIAMAGEDVRDLADCGEKGIDTQREVRSPYHRGLSGLEFGYDFILDVIPSGSTYDYCFEMGCKPFVIRPE